MVTKQRLYNLFTKFFLQKETLHTTFYRYLLGHFTETNRGIK